FTEEDKNKINELYDHFNFRKDSNYVNKLNYKVLDALAYGILAREGFGGKDKKIYTETLSDYENCTAEVISKKVVRTGTYVPGGMFGGSYD
ncbi:hypothetical protein, partial [Caballeronia sp. ATUFL_F1_KS39]|uniref:hypothetical protein n=1 Tax=Caballeronia sp. ATUFL_F1_KS39 TaxID=2921766 RepID=UPI0020283210